MNEAYVLLNVDFKKQKDVIQMVKKISPVKSVRTTYGIYDILVVLESNSMQEIKQAIDEDLHKIEGITNLTSLITIS